jgi:hypothetical protein
MKNEKVNTKLPYSFPNKGFFFFNFLFLILDF